MQHMLPHGPTTLTMALLLPILRTQWSHLAHHLADQSDKDYTIIKFSSRHRTFYPNTFLITLVNSCTMVSLTTPVYMYQ